MRNPNTQARILRRRLFSVFSIRFRPNCFDSSLKMTSREEYLKRYLSTGDTKEEKKFKKKRLKKKNVETRMKIVEDDVEIPFSAAVEPEKPDEIVDLEDEDEEIRPVVELVNNETDELKLLGKFQTGNWKSIQDEKDIPSTSPRRKRQDSPKSGDRSPPRRRRQGSVDPSPPRRRRDSSDPSPPRRRRQDSADINPPRRRRQDSEDPSPPRRRQPSQDVSPPRRRRQDSSKSDDPSPPRRRRRDSSDPSPPRRRQESKGPSPLSPPVESTIPIKRNIRRKHKEPTEEQKKRAEEMAKKYAVWNKGQKQVQEREQKLAEMAAEASKPFARHVGDDDLEDHLKNIEYNDDPMLAYMREKKQKETGSVSKPAYKGPWAPNRYSIPPGYRWDGVDRSNGFEVKLMASKNVKKAEEEEYYKWTSGQYE